MQYRLSQRNTSAPRLGRRTRAGRWLVAMLILLAAVSCNWLTGVDAPDLVDPSALENATGASARYSGAIGDFARGYADQVAETGLISDEFQDVGGNAYSSDRRVIPPTNNYPFSRLSGARISALRAISTLERFAAAPPQRIGELYALVGYIEVMLAENMCSPVPLATLADGTPAAAPSYDRGALLDDALAMFDSATAYRGANDTVANLASVGRARGLLVRGDFDGAANAVAGVPLTFEYSIPYSASTAGQANSLYDRIVVERYVTVADREGGNGLAYISGGDSRVGADSIGLSRSRLPLYNFVDDVGLGAPIVLASGVEAALIRAEAALNAGDAPAWSEILNSLRESAASPPLPLLSEDSTTAASTEERVSTLFHERAFWLFATGHRQGDMLRLIRRYGRAPEGTFPSGEYAPSPGVRYGPDIVFTPAGEEANSAYTGCTES